MLHSIPDETRDWEISRCLNEIYGESIVQVPDQGAVRVFAPFAGVLRSLRQVPDPAFCDGMLGEGIAIEPLDSCVVSPIDGSVVTVAKTGHSVTLRSKEGVELLIHVGIDTVSLKGDGFELQVVEGQQVRAGERLLLFDLDKIACRAKNCITPIIVVAGAAKISCERLDGPIRAGDTLFDVMPDRELPAQSAGGEATTAHVSVPVNLAHGIHARPAGRIARFARSQSISITLSVRDRSAKATSPTELLRLGVVQGDKVSIRVAGDNARKVAIELSELLEQMSLAEPVDQSEQSPAVAETVVREDLAPTERRGVKAAPGIAVGPIVRLQAVDRGVPEKGAGEKLEFQNFERAITEVRIAISEAAEESGEVAAEIAEAHLEVLGDAALTADVRRYIETGLSAPAAWRKASRRQEEGLLATGNTRMRERAIDFRDVERRIIDAMLGAANTHVSIDFAGSVVVCDDIEPSILMAEGSSEIEAICCSNGGATSHAAILAASAGIPMVVSLGNDILDLQNKAIVTVDANRGIVDLAPSSERLEHYQRRSLAARSRAEAATAASSEDCFTKDGVRIEVFANLASLNDAHAALTQGAEGCGLLRTEFLFSGRRHEPTEDEQAGELQAIARELDGLPFIIRTLDVGGDKPLPYFPFDDEANPALGLRGIRFGLKHRAVLSKQLRAMLRAVPAEQLRIMLPMVVETDEVEIVRGIVEELVLELGISREVPLGIMVETPAAALMSGQLAETADFFSIGSNDLAQYVLAMDRGNSELAARADALHPAVLRAIRTTVEGASVRNRWVGICGDLASEPDAAPLLVGLGCAELSAVPLAIPGIKQKIRAWSKSDCVALADEAIRESSAARVRNLLAGARS